MPTDDNSERPAAGGAPHAGPQPTDAGPQPTDATALWIQRGGLAKNLGAVDPGTSDTRFERWKRRCLQDWTLRRIRARLGPRSGRVVDLGCGYGDWTVAFAGLADQVIACDVSPGFVEETRRRLAEAGHRDAHVHCADIRSFDDFRDADLVYLGAVLMYLDDAACASVLATVRARIAPRGLVIAREWCAIGLGRSTVNTVPWFSVHRRPREVAALARAAGFRLVEQAASFSIYGEQQAHALGGERAALTRWLRWPLRLPWYLGSRTWTRGSVTFVLEPA